LSAWRSGLDRLLEDGSVADGSVADGLDRLAGRRYGLLAHAASLTADLRPAHLALSAAGRPPAVLFAPEHGYYGVEQDMVAAADAVDPWTGVPIRSLYGDGEATLRPAPRAFAGLDLLVVDLQDVGARYYTYAATAVWATEVALAAGCEVWLLDRPNPLPGTPGGAVEGNLPGEAYRSFVGAFRTPVCHGLTLGELMRLEAARSGWPRQPEVWPLDGWRRGDGWGSARPWMAPSPNMPDLATAVIYPGLCLIEASELSEGRGTTRPFRLVGAPGLDPRALADVLADLDLPGVAFVPTYFRPQFQKHAGRACGGVEILVVEPAAVVPFRLGVEVLFALRRVAGDGFAWRRAPYEFVSDRPAVDLLAGSDALRHAVESQDRAALDAWIATWQADEAAFRSECEPILLYPS